MHLEAFKTSEHNHGIFKAETLASDVSDIRVSLKSQIIRIIFTCRQGLFLNLHIRTMRTFSGGIKTLRAAVL